MRRLLAVAALAAIICTAAPASAQGLAPGVKGGVAFATQEISGGASSAAARVGPVAGGFVTLPLWPWLAVQAEGLYVAKGTKTSLLGIDSTLEIDYLEVPVLARVRLGEGRRHYFVDGGAVPAVRLRARTRTPFSTSTEEIDVADQIERFDLGIAAGGGVAIGSWTIEGRYTFGVRDIDRDKSDAIQIKNRVVAVTAGFRF